MFKKINQRRVIFGKAIIIANAVETWNVYKLRINELTINS